MLKQLLNFTGTSCDIVLVSICTFNLCVHMKMYILGDELKRPIGEALLTLTSQWASTCHTLGSYRSVVGLLSVLLG